MAYEEEDILQLSGTQHFLFCRRQWALIHVEQQWAENLRTADGRLMHQNVHDAQFRTRRGSTPRVKPTKACNACSLKDLCLPGLMRAHSVSAYLQDQLEETR